MFCLHVYLCTCVFSTHRDQRSDSLNWSYRRLWVATWVQELKSSVRTSALKSSLDHQLLHSFNFCLSDKPKDRVCLSFGIALLKSWTLFHELLDLSLSSGVYSRVSVMMPLFKTYACYFNPSAIDNIGPLMFQIKHQENTQQGWQHLVFAE